MYHLSDRKTYSLRKGKDLSVHTLLKSAHIRQDKVFKQISQEDLSSIEVYWHANCYSLYTSAHNIRHASACCDSSYQEVEESGRFMRLLRNPTDWSKCFICKKRRYKKIRELITVSTFEVCDSIKKAAEHQGDEDMLHMLRSVNDDLVASDAKYHKNCFSLYVAKKGKSSQSGKDTLYEPAFQEFTEDLATGIKKGKMYDVVSLLLRFQESLDKRGTSSESYTKQHLKSHLEKHFGDKIVFCQPSNRKASLRLCTQVRSRHKMFLMHGGKIHQLLKAKAKVKKQ